MNRHEHDTEFETAQAHDLTDAEGYTRRDATDAEGSVGRDAADAESSAGHDAEDAEKKYTGSAVGDDAGMTEEKMSDSSHEEKNNGKGGWKREIISDILVFGCVIAAMIVIFTFFLVNAKIPSESMEPTIMTNDQIFGNRLAYNNSDVKRYDIIIFKYPDNESELFIKRVIGLPGDVVDVHDGDVYINGDSTPLSDDFCALPDSTAGGDLVYPITVPENSYFVLGDNRMNSHDARYWTNTFVTKDEIVGKAIFRYWPLNKISVIHGAEDSYYEPDESTNPLYEGNS